MYIIKNALENVVRNKGRNILIAAIIFAIVATTVVALVINNTADAVINDYKNRFGAEVYLSPNRDNIKPQADGRRIRPQETAEQLIALAQSDLLQSYDMYGYANGKLQNLTAIDQDVNMDVNNCRIFGDYWQDFTNGNRSILSGGELPSVLNECVISQDLAELNNVNVGDTITIRATMKLDIPEGTDLSGYTVGDTYTANGVDYTIATDENGLDTISESGSGAYFVAIREVVYNLKITGIFYDLTGAAQMSGALSNRRNEILVTLDTLLSMRGKDENNVWLSATYYLKSPDLLNEFEQYCRAAGLGNEFDVSVDTAAYESVTKPIQGLKSISITFMAIVLILGAFVLFLLTSIAIRERKYEIGVLRAMGMKKAKVAFGLSMELLAITCVCLVVGLSVGSAVAQPVTNALIAQQVEATDSGMENNMQTTSGDGIPGIGSMNTTPLSEMQIYTDLNTILEIIAITLLLSTLAGIVSIRKITKYEPIKILMERN